MTGDQWRSAERLVQREDIFGMVATVPFEGGLTELLLQKRTTDPPVPALVSPDAPADLSDICMGLLRRDPDLRLSGVTILRHLDRDGAPAVVLDTMPAVMRDAPFVGRDGQPRVLNEAFIFSGSSFSGAGPNSF
jgi:hypothetical protein